MTSNNAPLLAAAVAWGVAKAPDLTDQQITEINLLLHRRTGASRISLVRPK